MRSHCHESSRDRFTKVKRTAADLSLVDMRLLVKLRALKDQAYDLRYHHKLQGFIYRLLEGTPYVKLHDRKGYKFFCFSNIFPPKSAGRENPDQLMKRREPRHLLISSPDAGMIKILNDRLMGLMENRGSVNIGEMSFEIESIKVFELRPGRRCTLITGVPIVLRIPKERFERYGIVPPRNYNYVYWRGCWSPEPFIKQLEANLFKKYHGFYGGMQAEFSVFEHLEFIKSTCNHVVLKGREIKMFGSLWKFHFSYLDKGKRNILQFGLDCGFGELNSLGFGFMNLERPNRVSNRNYSRA
jgi:CRISPR-associated endoribonuclease Cas6